METLKIWFDRFLRGVDFWVHQRFPILTIFILALWAPIVLLSRLLHPLMANVLLLDTYMQLSMFAMLNMFSIVFAMAIRRLIAKRWFVRNATAGSEIKIAKWSRASVGAAIFLAVISPITAYVYTYSQSLPSEIAQGEKNWLQITQSDQLWIDILMCVAAIVIGIFTAWVVMIVMGFLRSLFLGSIKDDENYFPFEDRDLHQQMQTRLRIKDGIDRSADIQLSFYLVLIGLVYILVVRPSEAIVGETYFSMPSYLVCLIWFGCLLLSGIANQLDKCHVPTLLVVVLVVLLMRLFASENHLPTNSVMSETNVTIANEWNDYRSANKKLVASFYQGIDQINRADIQQAKIEVDRARDVIERRAWEAIKKRMDGVDKGPNQEWLNPESTDGSGKKTLIIVTCPGGGIHAAAWSAYVLEHLDQRYRGFSDSICIISGVSGGSVGSVNFVANRYFVKGEPVTSLDTENWTPLDEVWYKACESSLEQIGAGLVFDDFPGTFFPPLQRLDRGLRLEQAWQARLPKDVRNHTIGEWGRIADAGQMPVVVLNATDAVSGRRILFSTLPTPPRESNDAKMARPFDYRELLKSTDIPVVSATRASATFPYVTPFASPENASKQGELVAIGDGGYVDNEGILTAVEWIDFLLKRQRKLDDSKVAFDRILLIRIQPTVDDEPNEPSEPNWLIDGMRWLTGPLEALASMRGSSQLERGRVETDLASANVQFNSSMESWSDALAAEDRQPIERADRRMSIEKFTKDVSKKQLVKANELLRVQNKVDLIQRGSTGKYRGKEAQEQIDQNMIEFYKDLKSDQLPGKQGLQRREPREIVSSLTNESADARQELASLFEAPVRVVTIPFVLPTSGKMIPLNWKLSERQLLWYPYAWSRLIEDEGSVISELDLLFHQRD